MIAPYTKRQRILWYPEVREDDIFLIVAAWREHQHEGRNICTAGKVEACVALAPDQRIGIYRAVAFVPCVHWHPAHRLLDPLVESQLSEQVFLGGIFLGAVVCCAELIHIHRYIQ